MENSFSVNVCIFASTCFARVEHIKGMVFCSFLHLFPFRFFPFLIIFKTGFSGYWNSIARFNIFQNWILKPNISGPQDPSPHPLTPNPKSNRTRHWRRGNPTCSNCQILYWFRSYFDELYCVKSALWPWLCAIYYQ